MAKKIAKLEKEFRNRIVGYAEVDPEQLLANAFNFRLHPDAQQQALAGAIDTLGYIDPVLVNRNTDTVIDGHLRVALAMRSGWKSIPVTYLDLTEDEERQALLMLDPIAAMAASDKHKLEDLLHQVNSDDERVQQMLADLAKENGLEYGEAPPEDPGPQIDKAEELREKWQVQSGQLWQLGEHRLICGDCTDRAVVERVMGGEKAQLIVTDPPYGLGKNYEGEDLSGDDFTEFHNKWLELACDITRDETTPFYIFIGCKTLLNFADVIRLHLVKPRLLIWYRPDGYGAGGSDYFYNYDPIFYGSISGKIGHFEFADYARDVWIANKAKPEAGGFKHSTVKALEVIEQPVRASSIVGDIVADFFLGSGTTLIACERLNRKCRAIEISAGYVAVAIQRWVDMTGGEPVLLT